MELSSEYPSEGSPMDPSDHPSDSGHSGVERFEHTLSEMSQHDETHRAVGAHYYDKGTYNGTPPVTSTVVK